MRGRGILGGAKRRTVIAALAVFGVAVAAPPAQAGLLVDTVDRCDAPVSKPFAQFGDYADYKAVRGGSFEPWDKAWKLTGGASIVSGNESYHVRSRSDSRSLRLPAGATATSPATCVGLEHPTLRYFKRSQALLGLAAMDVEALVETSTGAVVAVPFGVGLLSSSWRPSDPHMMLVNLLPLLPGEYTPVAFRFRAVLGTWHIDDVYVDPMRRR